MFEKRNFDVSSGVSGLKNMFLIDCCYNLLCERCPVSDHKSITVYGNVNVCDKSVCLSLYHYSCVVSWWIYSVNLFLFAIISSTMMICIFADLNRFGCCKVAASSVIGWYWSTVNTSAVAALVCNRVLVRVNFVISTFWCCIRSS